MSTEDKKPYNKNPGRMYFQIYLDVERAFMEDLLMHARSKEWATDALMSLFEATQRVGKEKVEQAELWETLGPRVLSRLNQSIASLGDAVLVADALDSMLQEARAKGYVQSSKMLVSSVEETLTASLKNMSEEQSRKMQALLPLLQSI